MELLERLSLVEKGAEEVVTRAELRRLLAEKARPRAYAGYEPSGKIHLGHAITVNKLIDLQEAGFEVTVLLADLHAYLNGKGALEEIAKTAEFNKECFIGMGLCPDRTKFVLGSEMQLQGDYFLNVQRLALETTLLRARRSMDMVGRAEEDPKVARVIYPLMQVIDMATLGVDLAVGGIDQRKIHMLARDNLPRLGYKAPVCLHIPIIHGLDGDEKMSSSKMNFLSVDDGPEEIKRKLRKAFCPMGELERNPVLKIYEHHIFRAVGRVVIRRPAKFGGDLEFENYAMLEEAYLKNAVHPQDLKEMAAEYMVELMEPVRRHLEGKGYKFGA